MRRMNRFTFYAFTVVIAILIIYVLNVTLITKRDLPSIPYHIFNPTQSVSESKEKVLDQKEAIPESNSASNSNVPQTKEQAPVEINAKVEKEPLPLENKDNESKEKIPEQQESILEKGSSSLEDDDNEYNKTLIRNEEWEQLSKSLFFRRTAAFYFHNRAKIYLYGLGRYGFAGEFKLDLIVTHKGAKYNLTYGKSRNVTLHTVFSYWSDYEMRLIGLDDFDILNELNAKHNLKLGNDTLVDETNFKIRAFVHDTSLNLSTKYPLNVRIKAKHLQQTKQGSSLCSGVLYHDSMTKNETSDDIKRRQDQQYEELQWWIENNKQIGHRKVMLCNNSIPNTDEFNQLLEKHKDFVEIYQLRYIPNFVYGKSLDTDHVNDYLTSMKQLNYRAGDHALYIRSIDIIKVFFFNECFNDYIDTYQHVGVIDMDELFIPNTMKNFTKESQYIEFVADTDLNGVNNKQSLLKIFDVECKADNSTAPPIDVHISNLFQVTNTRTSYRFYSDKHFPIKSEKYIIEELEKYFNSNLSTNETRHSLNLTEPTDKVLVNYTLVIDGPRDVNYAKNLIKLYRLLVDDFNVKKHDELQKYTKHNVFNRFIYLNRPVGDEGLKVIYNTDTNLIMHVHFAFMEKVASLEIANQYARYSHFRSKTKMENGWVINVKEIGFDFNYLFCYYRKVLKNIASIDILE